MPYFVYGMVRESDPPLQHLTGIDGAPVRRIAGTGDIAALVSEVSDPDILPMRAHLKAFQTVIGETAACSDVLPVSFGLVAGDDDEVATVLTENGPVLSSELARIAGKVEFTLRLNYAGDNVFAWFVERDAELRRYRDTFFRDGREPTRDEKITLGQAFERALEAERAARNGQLADDLGDLAAEVTPVSFLSEAGLAALALLVPRQHRAALEARVDAVAGEFSDDYLFEFTGPWPPYSFIELQLSI